MTPVELYHLELRDIGCIACLMQLGKPSWPVVASQSAFISSQGVRLMQAEDDAEKAEAERDAAVKDAAKMNEPIKRPVNVYPATYIAVGVPVRTVVAALLLDPEAAIDARRTK